MGFSYDRAAKKEADAKRADEKPFTGKGRYGTAPPLTSHGGRSRVAKREGGKTLRDAVTAGCHAVLKRFIGTSFANRPRRHLLFRLAPRACLSEV